MKQRLSSERFSAWVRWLVGRMWEWLEVQTAVGLKMTGLKVMTAHWARPECLIQGGFLNPAIKPFVPEVAELKRNVFLTDLEYPFNPRDVLLRMFWEVFTAGTFDPLNKREILGSATKLFCQILRERWRMKTFLELFRTLLLLRFFQIELHSVSDLTK